MANYAAKFIDPSGDYTGGYTSETLEGNSLDNSVIGRGLIQISITSGTVTLQGKLTTAAPWVTIKVYNASTLEEIVISPFFRVIASGDAECFYAETT